MSKLTLCFKVLIVKVYLGGCYLQLDEVLESYNY